MFRVAMVPWLLMLPFAAIAPAVSAQQPLPPIAHRGRKLIHPTQNIPVQQFGYSAPGKLPTLQGYQLVEMLYLDGKHLLFSFNVPALMELDITCAPQNDNLEHRERAVVMDLPSHTKIAATDWDLDDYGQFVWPLPHGEFLLRRCANLSNGNLDLHEVPIASAHQDLLMLEMSPSGTHLLLEWKKDFHVQVPAKTATPTTSATAATPIDPRPIVAEFFALDPLAIVAKSKLDVPAYVPLLGDGFLEMESLPHDHWRIDFQPYAGKLQVVTTFRSGCQPGIYSLTDTTFFVDTCNEYFSAKSRQAYDLNGHLLWRNTIDLLSTRPVMTISQDESVFAIATLRKTFNFHTDSAINNLDTGAGQDINVFSAQTGKKLLRVATTPIYMAGGNFALSPKGDHLAVLQNGVIEIYPIQK